MKAYELIDHPDKWLNRNPRDWEDEHCAVTAIMKAYAGTDIYPAMLKLLERTGADYIADWNDESTWEVVYGTLKDLDI